MHAVLKEMYKIGIVPVVVLEDVNNAVSLAKALLDGGLPCAEVTFRTEAAKESLKAISTTYPEMLIGAGTVLTCAQVDNAMEAGAQFIVTPNVNPKIVTYCQKLGVPIVPGCSTASEIGIALELGIEVVKFFPAETAGGIDMIKSLSGPFPTMKFMPTGGIIAENLNSYLAVKSVLACGGSWMVKHDVITAGNFDKITEMTRDAITKMLDLHVMHVGINMPGAPEAVDLANEFNAKLGLPLDDRTGAVFVSSGIEICKQKFLGTHGHIALKVSNVDRAMYHYGRRGVEFDPNHVTYASDGSAKLAYFKNEMGGFAIHFI
jgi:2-dehydro-3-deoxyphosphogluconate aldolase/(4S)-4-hydroxy-2-oxoglutarate aldolase